MNILMIGWYKPQVGGGSHVVQNLTAQLKNQHKIYVINTEEKGLPFLGRWQDSGVLVFQERLYFDFYTPIQTVIQTTKRALLLKLNKDIDLYHVHGPFFAGIGLIDKKTPLIMTMHGYPSLETLARGRIKPDSVQFKFIRFLEVISAKRAEAIIAVDKRIYRWIICELGIDPSKVFYLPNAVNTKKFSPSVDGRQVRAKYNLNENPVILYVKALSPKNGPEVAIKAMDYVIKEHPNAILLMVGDGPLKPQLEHLASKLGLRKNVIFVGRKPPDETPFYFAASDIVIVPSVHIHGVEEATSLTMLEGMASGKPVVVSNIGGLKGTIEIAGGDGKVGLLFKQGNPKDLASKIIMLLEDKSFRKKLGHNARKYVVKNRDWAIYAARVLKIYEYAMNR